MNSRTPRPTKSTNSLRPRNGATPIRVSPGASGARLQVPGTPSPRQPSPSPRKKSIGNLRASTAENAEPSKEKLSLKEQIALKRAEAKKAAEASRAVPEGGLAGFGIDDDPLALKAKKTEDDMDSLGRWSIRETIERARSSGNLNLSSRSLVCIPSCLYEIHLGVTPKPLDSVTEPDYSADSAPKRVRASKQQPSWYEAQDLTILKARSNEIVALQREISLFGSLKVVDLHSNRLTTLPTSIAILASLTTLDISNNNLNEIPPALFSLPALTTLNAANNQLTSLTFSKFDDPIELPDSLDTGAFFQPEVARANRPLPSLCVLNVENNKLSSSAIDTNLPSELATLMLGNNPLRDSGGLLLALSELGSLKEIDMSRAEIKDDSFGYSKPLKFPRLQLLDLSDTEVTERAVRSLFKDSPRAESISFEVSNAPPSPGELRVRVGKKVIKEEWEIEAEKHYLRKKKSTAAIRSGNDQVEKENWEIGAEQGVSASRRGRLAAASARNTPQPPVKTRAASQEASKTSSLKPATIEKEQWEIEAELGLTSEAGRRKARAQQAIAERQKVQEPASPAPSKSPRSLADSTYYTKNTQTLALPPSAPPTRSHSRNFSLAAKLQTSTSRDDMSIPAPTLPLDIIAKEDFVLHLRVLILSNRRADPTFHLPPPTFVNILPQLQELSLDGCALGDTVNVSQASDADGSNPKLNSMNVLQVIADIFPGLTVLDLSYNTITSNGLTSSVLKRMLVPSPDEGKKGLKTLRLRGNKLASLEAFEPVAELFRGNRQVSEWQLEELDVRDNEISKLPVLLGLMPLDVFLVEGNLFRIPQRKVWEREGTRGLLSWLRGRIE